MEITLSVSSSPTLPVEVLLAFGDRAKEHGKSPTAFLASLIEREARKRPSRHAKTPHQKGAVKQ